MNNEATSNPDNDSPQEAERVLSYAHELDTSLLQGHGRVDTTSEPDQIEAQEGFSIRRALRMALLGVAGFLLGIIIFLPADSLWIQALNRLNTDATSFSWTSVEPSGLFGAKIQDARLNIHGLTLHFTEMRIDPGLMKPLRIQGVTGQHAMDVTLSWGKRLMLQGQADTGVLFDAGKPLGLSTFDADLQFNDWADLPEKGTLKVQGLTIELSPKLSVANLELDLTKQGQDVRIDSLGTEKPLPMQAQGTLKLEPGKLLESAYSVNGTITMGNKNNKFKKSGKLGELAKLAQGGNMAGLFQ